MNSQEKVALVWKRFVHRSDAYVKQWSKADKGIGYWRVTDGHCTNTPKCGRANCEHMQNVPLTHQDVLEHLQGTQTIGLYQLSPDDDTVKWLCIDIDKRKSEEDVREVVEEYTLLLAKECVKVFGKGRFLVEYSGSKGYHIWVFFSEPIIARKVLSIGQWLVSRVPYPIQLGIEVFPKQQDVRSRYGSQVKMPLGVHLKTNNRCFFVKSDFEPYEDQWTALANVGTLSEHDVDTIISTNNIEEVRSIRVDRAANGRMSLPCMERVMLEGLREGTRDVGLFKLAGYLKDRGAPSDIVESALIIVNQRSSPPVEPETLYRKIESAFQADYSSFPCNEPALDSYCSSKCRFWPGKVEERWSRYNRDSKDAQGVISRD